jgi:hypothetical protein
MNSMNRNSGMRMPVSVSWVPARFESVSMTSDVVTNVKMMASNTHQKNVIVTAIHGTPGFKTLLPMRRMKRNGSRTSSDTSVHSPMRIICPAPSSAVSRWSANLNTPPQNANVARAMSHQVTSIRLTNVRRRERTMIVGRLRTLVQ